MENETDISEYSDLWDDPASGWVLFHLNANKENEIPEYAIFNIEKKIATIIEDENECSQVKKKMLKEGVQIVTKM
jgi:hypothetical protein